MIGPTTPHKLAFGHRGLQPGDEHVAGYGARLLWDEVADGSSGVVYDRQDAFGDPDLIKRVLHPAVEAWTDGVRDLIKAYRLTSSSDVVVGKELETPDGHVIVQGSPQGSYGYLYVTALLVGDVAALRHEEDRS